MTFLLCIPAEARDLRHTPLSRETCEFLLQVCFECSCNAVLLACGLKRKTPREVFNKTFGGVKK
jgi:hypothetical protein